MDLLTRVEFAEAHGVSRAAVTMAVKRGTLASTPDGEIDLRHELTVKWVIKRKTGTDPDKIYAAIQAKRQAATAVGDAQRATKVAEAETRRATNKAGRSDKIAAKITKDAAVKQAAADDKLAADMADKMFGGEIEHLPPLAEIDPSELGRYKKSSLDKIRIYEGALKVQQDREAKRGDLIPRVLVSSLFSKLHAVDANALRTLEERLIPTICSVAGLSDDDPRVIKIQKAINKETTHILRHVQRLIDTFLKKYAE